jgi:diacylglycerol kinase (ATP)
MKPEIRTLQQRLIRIFSAFVYSSKGFLAAWRHEAAFRDELVVSLALIAVAIMSSVTLYEKTCLILSLIAVLVVELLNSAIEAVVDLVAPQYHELAGRAKDLGSAAVLLAIICAATTWGVIFLR